MELEVLPVPEPGSSSSRVTAFGSPATDPLTPPTTILERRLLRRAARHFRKKEYADASNLYFEVMSSRPGDARVSHNLAISQFYNNHLRDTDGFLQQFLSTLSQAKVKTGSGEFSTDKEITATHPVFLYNLAVIYFQDSQPWKSLEIAITLLQHLCSIDASCALAMRTKLLIAELYFTLQKYGLALEVIETTAQLYDVMRISPTLDDTDPSSAKLAEMKHTVKVKMKEQKALALLSNHSVSFGRVEYKDFRDLSSDSSDDSGRVPVQFLKAYHNYLGGNIRKALTVVSAIPVSDSDGFFLKTGDNLQMMINNNIGCCHYSMGKPTVAAWYFQKASQDSNKADYKDRETLPLHCLGFNKKYEIMYNFGVSLLHAKKSVEAFNVLTRCQSAFPANPRLWLRIAECCVQIHKSTNADDFALTQDKRNIFLGIEPQPNKSEPTLTTEIIDIGKPTPSLLYSRHCITMAVPLINAQRVDVGPSNPITEISELDTLRSNIFSLGAYINLSLGNYTEAIEFANDLLAIPNIPNVFEYLGKLYLYEALFRQGSLCNGHDLFPEQCIENYTMNLTVPVVYSNANGKIPKNKPRLSSPSSFKPASEWTPRDDISAKSIMIYNRAVALTEINQFEAAMALVDGWIVRIGYNNGPIPPDFILIAIHLNLKLGNKERAAEIYRQHCPPVNLRSRAPLSTE